MANRPFPLRPPACSGKVAAGLAILAAVVLRFAFLLREDVWYDEAWSIHMCSLSWGEMAAWVRGDLHPMLYHAAAKAFSLLFGDSSRQSLRLFSALWGLAAIIVCTIAGRRLYDSWLAGLLGAAVLAWLPMHLYYSAECRMYAMGGTLVLLGGLGWLAVERTAAWTPPATRFRWALLLGPAACAAAVSTHFVAGVQLAVFALLFAPWANRRRWADWFFYWGFAAVLSAPELSDLAFRVRLLREGAGWIPPPGAMDALRGCGRAVLVPVDYWVVWMSAAEEKWWGWLLVDLLPLILALWFACGLRAVPRSKRRLPGLLLVTFFLATLVQWTLTRLGIRCFFWLRYGALLLPLAALGAGPILIALWRRSRVDRVILTTAAILVIGVGTHASVARAHRWFGPVRVFLDQNPRAQPLYVCGTTFWPEYEINLGAAAVAPAVQLPAIADQEPGARFLLVVDVPDSQRPPEDLPIIAQWLPRQNPERVLESDDWVLWRVD